MSTTHSHDLFPDEHGRPFSLGSSEPKRATPARKPAPDADVDADTDAEPVI
ncbi:hypothetical protein [Burkholderia ubonensis]|uniref:hypothetical protein n=1 Tax=Burkholderia ubonensis TaxID=101571 RepID=UPI0018DF2BD1|nr:hypothetical protein [Burkholderia ubonensis]